MGHYARGHLIWERHHLDGRDEPETLVLIGMADGQGNIIRPEPVAAHAYASADAPPTTELGLAIPD